ncbi:MULTISPECIES: hypothetical protein [unclassified Burkholderia]|uniref:hypothetical protein n=1 Tax=unclassified Burkholderia TaxID=2613784 RepID=UPI00075828A1|nr:MULTISPECIES: hypothetical protein [unclassified Burkholderia]KVN17942.1 hypothetical protein WT08_02085 [Burkholderia sp. MSMB1552]KWZ55508.1 hypothetical protein WS92_05995 [Burkholderia sp. MSMB1588]
MAILTVTAAIAGLKNTIDLAKAAVAARDELKLAEMQQSINDRVIDVQNAALALQEKQAAARDEIDELKEQLRTANAKLGDLERALGERAEYKLHAVSERGFVYRFVGQDEPEHFICQPCYDGPERRKTVLRFTPRGQYSVASYSCPTCRNIVRL